MSNMSSVSRYHLWLALHRRNHTESVYHGHNGIVRCRTLTANIHAYQISVINLQTVWHSPNLQVSLSVVSQLHLRVRDGVIILHADVHYDVGSKLRVLLIHSLHVVYRIRIEYQSTRVSERIFLINRSLGSTCSMGGKLVSVVSVPFYRLKASTLLPHSPEELSCLTITLRTGTSVSVLQKPLGKCSSVLYRSHILFDEETRNKEERISIIILWVHCQLALVVEETRVTSTGTLEYLHVVFQWVDTTGYRRNHTLRIMLWCLLPIGYLRIVGAVEVATTHRIEVLEGCNRQRTSSDCLHTIRYLKIVGRIFVWREL